MIFSREYYARFSGSGLYPWVLGGSAYFLMISGLVPFEVILIPAVAASAHRWKTVCVAAVLGSALGAATLAFLFQSAGWSLLDHLFPLSTQSHGWSVAQDWTGRYGVWALIAIAALPIAQAPALAVAGLLQVPALEVFLAFLIGKALKYAIISLLVEQGETRFQRRVMDARRGLRNKSSECVGDSPRSHGR